VGVKIPPEAAWFGKIAGCARFKIASVTHAGRQRADYFGLFLKNA
jgi:hypothetical protein